MLESEFQSRVIQDLRDMFEDCLILKNDSSYLQGIPDLTILYKDKWAMLEVKSSIFARFRPNQEWYLDKLDAMSFATMICPENQEEVYIALQRAFGDTSR